MADLREMIQALTPEVPLPQINTATGVNGIDAAGNVWVYTPPTVEEFQAEGAPFLSLSGGTMTGPLILANATPVQPLEAASKSYVDSILNNANLTGIPTAPTAPVATSNNQLATTAFVHAAVAAGGTFVDAPADGFDYGRRNNNWDRVLGLGGGTLSGGLNIDNAYLRLNGPPGSDRQLLYTTNYVARWKVDADNQPETGSNNGSNYNIFSYADDGSFINTALSISRGSGAIGTSGPRIWQLSPYRQLFASGSFPNSTTGNLENVGPQDQNPPMPLPANPLATTAGSPTVTVTWPGSGNPVSGWMGVGYGLDTWVNLQGATAVGGITPAGWLRVQSIIDNDHVTVTWTANATDTETGGGTTMTAQPAHSTILNWVQSHATSGAAGYIGQTAELWEAAPAFQVPSGEPLAPRYEHRWHWTVGPPDSAGIYNQSISAIEWDLTNRGHDWGYQPNIYAANQPSVAFWVGPVMIPAWAVGGGTVSNWNTVYTVFSGQSESTAVYQAFSTQPNALVGQKFDPTGHGGVGVDLFGGYVMNYRADPFSTVVNSNVVTMQVWPDGDLVGIANGDQVYIPVVYTINGVTFGGGIYPISNVNVHAGTFTITGNGLATATGSGGGPAGSLVVYLLPYAPYAPVQFWGLYQHGIITNPNSHFLSGAIIETQPGNAIQWSDGFGAAWVTAAVATPGVVNLVLSATASVEVAGSLFTSGTNPIQAGQAGSGNSVTLRPGAMGTGYADVTSGGIDANVDLRLIAAGTGTVRVMSPLTLVGGISGSFGLQPGNAITWSDGTGTASISATATTAGNLGIRLAPAGTGLVTMAAPLTIVPGPSPVGPQVTLDCSTVTSWAQVQFILNPANNNAARLYSQRGGVGRWNLFVGDTDPESGSSSGCNFQIQGVLDNGTTIPGTPALKIIRASNQVNMGGALTVNGLASLNGGVNSNGTILALGSNIIQAGQPGASNIIALTPGAPGSGFSSISTNGPDANIDLRLVALGAGTVRMMSPLSLAAGINGLVTMQAGQALRWSDGTNISSINVPAGANSDLTISPPGTGRLVTGANLLIWGPSGVEEYLDIRTTAGAAKSIYFRSGTATRWIVQSDVSTEAGANAGSNFLIGRFNDNGTYAGTALTINRATGNITFSNSIGVNGAVPPARPTVTGSRTDGTALASLIAAMVSYGMVTDASTP